MELDSSSYQNKIVFKFIFVEEALRKIGIQGVILEAQGLKYEHQIVCHATGYDLVIYTYKQDEDCD